MYIDQFRKMIVNNKTRVECVIDHVNKILIECDEKYIDSVQENYDGFLVLVLVVAMKKNETIEINGLVSFKLYYNIVNHVMPIIKIVHPNFSIIKIKIKGFTEEIYGTNDSVGCGLSCGVDSLSCIEDYYFKNCRSFKLTHLTNFFAGATTNRTVYENKLVNIQNYVDEIGLDFLQVYTNFHKINNLEHQYFHTLRNLAVPLFFQKLFRRYYYASSFSYLNSKIIPDSKSITSTEPILIPLLSTENLELLIHGCQYSRIRKTNLICNNNLAHKYLDVCVHPTYYETIKEKINCSKCYKCLRTCATLDYYDCLDKFEAVFDIELYQKYKKEYLENLEMTNPYDRELKGRYYFENQLYLDIKYNIKFEDLPNLININEQNSDNENINEQYNNDYCNEQDNNDDQNNNEDNEGNEEINNNENNEEINNNENNNEPNYQEKNIIFINNNNNDKKKQELIENKKKMICNRIVQEENIYNENNSFQEYMMNYASNNTDNINNIEINNTEKNISNNNVKVKFNINVENEKKTESKNDKNYRIWWAFKKDWDLLVKANQIRANKDVIVKKNKDLHSSQLDNNEKISYKKGKLFKLEKEQDDELYYKIFI